MVPRVERSSQASDVRKKGGPRRRGTESDEAMTVIPGIAYPRKRRCRVGSVCGLRPDSLGR